MTEEEPTALDAAWKVHSAQLDWTGKVDSKASFALAIESALVVGVMGLTGSDRRLSDLNGLLAICLFWAGLASLVVGLVAVIWVVRPRLRSKTLQKEAEEDFIFFGHARLWTPEDLEGALVAGPLLPVLTRQIVRVSKLNWQKHRLLQISLEAAALGGGLIGLAAACAG